MYNMQNFEQFKLLSSLHLSYCQWKVNSVCRIFCLTWLPFGTYVQDWMQVFFLANNSHIWMDFWTYLSHYFIFDRIVHLSELLSVRTIYHAHFKEPKILDISTILEAATIFIPLPFRVLLFSITWSSVAISNIRSVSNRFNAGIRLNVRWHSECCLDSLCTWSSHNYFFFKPWHSFLQNAFYRSLEI